jgi:hypothetical protein
MRQRTSGSPRRLATLVAATGAALALPSCRRVPNVDQHALESTQHRAAYRTLVDSLLNAAVVKLDSTRADSLVRALRDSEAVWLNSGR